jgi:uncharacterized ion transporter superfamily protein YfcC
MTAAASAPAPSSAPRRRTLDPVVMMVGALALAIALTWIIPSGAYQRLPDGTAVPGTYHAMPKVRSVAALLPVRSTQRAAVPASPVALFTALPVGMGRQAGLIFMIMFLGGMFGVLRSSGALEAAIERMVALSGGRAAVVAPCLMIAISAGSSFLGLISEYLLIIPIVLALSQRLGRGVLFGFAIVTVAGKIGYLGSVTNPVILMVAQPIAGVPVFSGLSLRLFIWVVFLLLGIGVVVREGRAELHAVVPAPATALSSRHLAIVGLVCASVALIIYGSAEWHWRDGQFAGFYLALAVAVGVAGGMSASRITHALIDGMKSMVLAAFLVGMAGAVEVVLTEGRILDTIVHGLASLAEGLPRVLVGAALVLIEMVLTFLIPSGSAKAALSMPILVPIARLAGISGQTTVLAFLMGNGLVNMISPTSGMLLAYLATAQLPFSTWFRFILPLFGLLTVLAFGVIAFAVQIGY